MLRRENTSIIDLELLIEDTSPLDNMVTAPNDQTFASDELLSDECDDNEDWQARQKQAYKQASMEQIKLNSVLDQFFGKSLLSECT